MTNNSQSKWDRDVKKGILKIPQVANVNTPKRRNKNHKKLVVEYEDGKLFPLVYAKPPSCPRAMKNIIKFVERKASNDNFPPRMDG